MSEERSRRFNLPALLRLEELDIRKVIKSNSLLRVGEYNVLLSNFLVNMPMAKDTFNRIIAREMAENDSWSLSYIKTMLEDIGCKKFSNVINDIIRAGKRGHHQFASDHAKEMLENIDRLYSKIAAAEIPETVTDDLNTDETGFEYDDTQTLSTALLMLDHEEATRKLRILAVDDAPVMINTISSVLSDEYKVYGMTNPTMLENFLRQITPDLFLLDYKMPEISGFDCIPIIRSFEEHKDTPIIFLTALGTSDHVAAALALGACDFIVKPFQGNILKEKIAKHIVRKKLF